MNWDKQSNTHNDYVQSLEIKITPIGYDSWENQDKTKQ